MAAALAAAKIRSKNKEKEKRLFSGRKKSPGGDFFYPAYFFEIYHSRWVPGAVDSLKNVCLIKKAKMFFQIRLP